MTRLGRFLFVLMVAFFSFAAGEMFIKYTHIHSFKGVP